MSNRFVRSGDSIQHAPAAAVANGALVAVGTLAAVAQEDVAAAAVGTFAVVGCWRLPKAAVAVAQGQMLHRKAAGGDAGKLTAAAAVAGDLENCAVALTAATANADDVEALLLPGRGAVKA